MLPAGQPADRPAPSRLPRYSPAARRPKNSALEVDLDFETTVKPPPQVRCCVRRCCLP